jgi:hypothetical protein
MGADRWAQHGRDPHNEHQRGEHPGGLVLVEQVAHHGPAKHDPSACTQGLDDTARDQLHCVSRERTPGRTHHEDDNAQ